MRNKVPCPHLKTEKNNTFLWVCGEKAKDSAKCHLLYAVGLKVGVIISIVIENSFSFSTSFRDLKNVTQTL